MNNISTVVEAAIKKHTADEMPELKGTLSYNLEFRLFSTIDMSKKFREARKNFVRNYFNDILTLSLGNISLAARKANLHRRQLHRLISELNLDTGIYRKEMLKPSEYLKVNVQNIVEETLSDFPTSEEKLKQVYSNIEDISEIIAKNVDTISYDEAIFLFEKEYLERALRENNYSVQRTASAIEMSERTLYRKIARLNLNSAVA